MRAPRWPILLSALLVLGGGSGCPGGSPPCFSGGPSQRPEALVFGVGREAVFNVTPVLVRACDEQGTPRQPESVTVEVKDPENRPVPATAELSADGSQATLRFTSHAEGRHHVIVSFSPVGSLQQLGVFVLADRRGEAPMARLPGGVFCTHLERTPRGTWVCGNRAQRDADTEAQDLGPLPGTTVVADDVVWVVAGDTVRRYVDTGAGALELTGTAPYPPGASQGVGAPGPHARLATPDELVVLSDGLLHRYTVTGDGGITTAPTTAWPSSNNRLAFGSDSAGALLLRAGSRLLVVTRIQDTRTFEARTQACPFQLGTGGTYAPVTDEACHAVAGEPVGYEDGVVWARTGDVSGSVMQEALRRFAVKDGRLVESGGVSMEGQMVINVPRLRPGPAVPFLAAPGTMGPFAVPRWNPDSGRVELELAPTSTSQGSSVPQVNEDFIWLNTFDGSGLAVYPRASTP